MLSLPTSIGYIHEPFNLFTNTCNIKFDYWYTYICEENEKEYMEDIVKILKFQLPWKKAWQQPYIRKLGYFLQASNHILNNRFRKARPLIKDPIALFSVEWLVDKFDMDVIVMLRHPAAFAGSLKMANWRHDFNHFLLQPLLMKKYLSKYQQEIEKFAARQDSADIIEHAVLMWKIVHYFIWQLKNKYPNWHFIKHEEISNNPIRYFKRLYTDLDIVFTPEIKNKIAEYSGLSSQSSDIVPSELKRDSKNNVHSWKKRLTLEEIQFIRSEVNDISKNFYADDEW